MTKCEATTPIDTTLRVSAQACERAVKDEDADTLEAIADGLAQAQCGEYVSDDEVLDILGRVWRSR